MKKIICLYLVLPTLAIALFQQFAFAQKVNIDSLLNVWNDFKQPDTIRLKAISKVASQGYMRIKPDSAIYYAQLQYSFANIKGQKQFAASALNTQGGASYLQGKYDNAIDYYMRSLKISETIGDKKKMANSYNNIGLVYKGKGNHIRAIEFYMKSLTIRESLGDKYGMAGSLGNLGLIYKDQNDYEKANDYLTRCLRIFEELNDDLEIANTQNNIGIVFLRKGDFANAFKHYTQGLNKMEDIKDSTGIAFSLNLIGDYFEKINEYHNAIEYYNKAYKIYESMGNKSGLAVTLNGLGGTYRYLGVHDSAVWLTTRALDWALSEGDAERVMDASEVLYVSYKALGNKGKALEMHELYTQMRDSILSEENQREVIRHEYKYNYEKQTLADSIVNAEAQKVKDAQIQAQKAKLQKEKNQRYALVGGLGLVSVFSVLMYNRFMVTRKQKNIIAEQKIEVEEKNKHITDSIQYALRIQTAILPPDKLVKEYLKNSFILYLPKDIVAGDFYWMETTKDVVLFAACDCTGHGVPGAMVSVMCHNALNRTVREYGLTEPAKILDKLVELVQDNFTKSEEDIQDGMDASLCAYYPEQKKLQWAGANNPLWLVRNGELIEYKPDKQPIGKYEYRQPYTNHEIDLQQGDTIYIFSDGYADQFGDDGNKKLTKKGLKNILLSIQNKSMEDQREELKNLHNIWKGQIEQIDDICVIGVRV